MKHVFLLLLGWVAVAGPTQAAPLVHLPFDEDGSDATGHRHHAQVRNNAGITTERFRLGGGAATFDGVSGYYQIPSFAPAVSNAQRSVAFWLRASKASGEKPNKIFIGWGDPSPVNGVRFDIGLEEADDSRLRTEFNFFFVVSTTDRVNFCDGAWHHVAVTYDGERLSYYVDGRTYGRPVKPRDPVNTVRSVAGTVIGAGVREGGGFAGRVSRFFCGELDDVGIWDTALTELDVALLHGLGTVGDNDLRWLEAARKLWQQPAETVARINGRTWRRVDGLPGREGDCVQTGGPNGAGSFLVLAGHGGLQVSPQWWESRTLQLTGVGVLLAVAGVLAAWSVNRMRWRWQLRQIEERERKESERRRLAQDLHDDLGSGLTEIMLLGDLAGKERLSADDLKARLASVARKSRDLVAAVDEIVWTANPVNDELPKLVDYLCAHAQRFLGATGIACRIEVGEHLPVRPISAKARHHVLLALKEALNNAVKHSGAAEIWVRIRCEAEELCLAIEDNGQGFDPATARRGNGLANMRSRFTQLGGYAEIQSQPGQGTKVWFRLPLNRATG